METKTLPLDEVEFKFASEAWTVEGYASVFNSVDKAGDTVLKGAFSESIQKQMPLMRYEHLRWVTPGIWNKAVEDDRGLLVSGELTKGNHWAEDLRASLQHGTIRGLSIGFAPIQKKSNGRGSILQKVFLKEVSFTADPMEPLAQVESWKSEILSIESLSDCEAFLRESGVFSKSMATAFIGHLKAILLSESEQADEEQKRILNEQVRAMKSRFNRPLLKLQTLTKEDIYHG